MGRLTDTATRVARETPQGPRCSVGKLRLKLKNADRAELDALLADQAGYTAETVRAALIREARGLEVDSGDIPSGHTLQRHRTGKCRCGDQ